MVRKAIIYYTDNNIDEQLRKDVAKQLVKAAKDIPIISVSWKPIDLGLNVVVPYRVRADETIFKQIVVGAENTDADIIFLAEHDVLYHPSHFEFTAPRDNTLYFNENKWRWANHKAVFRRLQGKAYGRSQMTGYRKLIINNYTGNPCVLRKKFISVCPNVDIRHKDNFTNPKLFKKDSITADGVPFWRIHNGNYQ